MQRIVVGISGATGAIYGVRLLEALHNLKVETHLVLSDWATRTIEFETQHTVDQVKELASFVHHNKNVGAPVASGSFRTDGMVVIPCSMKTLSGIANGYADNLIVRAADVMLKEHRKLVLVARESPLNSIHLENMLRVTHAGAVLLPPMPAFYNKPSTLDDIINHLVARVLDQFGLEHHLSKRWGEDIALDSVQVAPPRANTQE